MVAGVLSLAIGCASPESRAHPGPYPTPAEVVEMTRSGKSPDAIIQEILDSRQPYIVSSQEVEELLRQGVDQSVVQAMQDSAYRLERSRSLRSTSQTFMPLPLRQQGQGSLIP
jgi:hypothetical protein